MAKKRADGGTAKRATLDEQAKAIAFIDGKMATLTRAYIHDIAIVRKEHGVLWSTLAALEISNLKKQRQQELTWLQASIEMILDQMQMREDERSVLNRIRRAFGRPMKTSAVMTTAFVEECVKQMAYKTPEPPEVLPLPAAPVDPLEDEPWTGNEQINLECSRRRQSEAEQGLVENPPDPPTNGGKGS